MDKEPKKQGVPFPSVDASMTTRAWWFEDAVRMLPGELGGATVFEIRFWDGCRYLGHTDSSVFECVDDLVASPFGERRSAFVAEHCARMGSVVRVVASDLDPAAAAELRDEIFSTRVAPRCQSRRSLHSLRSPMRGHGLQCTRSKRRE